MKLIVALTVFLCVWQTFAVDGGFDGPTRIQRHIFRKPVAQQKNPVVAHKAPVAVQGHHQVVKTPAGRPVVQAPHHVVKAPARPVLQRPAVHVKAPVRVNVQGGHGRVNVQGHGKLQGRPRVPVGHPGLRFQGPHRQGVFIRGRPVAPVRGQLWVQRQGARLPLWARGAVVVLPRRRIIQRPGCVRTGAKLYYIVTITQVQSTAQLTQLAIHLVDLLVQKSVIHQQLGANILHNVGITAGGRFAHPNARFNVITVKHIIVKGFIKARARFVHTLHLLISRPASHDVKVKIFVRSLLELVLDNEHLRIPGAVALALKFGVRITAIARTPGANLQVQQAKHGAKIRFISIVRVVRGQPEKVVSFVNHLLVLLVRRRIVDVRLVKRLLVTFGVAGHDKFVGSDKEQPLNVNDLVTIKIRGRQIPHKRFLFELHSLLPNINNKPRQERLDTLVRIILELVLDNGIRNAKQVETIALKTFSLTVTIHRVVPNPKQHVWLVQKIVGQLPTKPRSPPPVVGLIYFHTVTYHAVLPKDKAHSYINRILEILVTRKVIDVHVARTLLLTFKMKPAGKFEGPNDAKPYTPENISKVTIKGNPFARAKFVNILLQLILGKQPQDDVVNTFSKVLLELSLDNNAINIKNAGELAKTFGVKIVCQKLPAPQPKTPAKPDDKDGDDSDENSGEKPVDSGEKPAHPKSQEVEQPHPEPKPVPKPEQPHGGEKPQPKPHGTKHIKPTKKPGGKSSSSSSGVDGSSSSESNEKPGKPTTTASHPHPQVPQKPDQPQPQVPHKPEDPQPHVPREPEQPRPHVPHKPNEPQVPREPEQPRPHVPHKPEQPQPQPTQKPEQPKPQTTQSPKPTGKPLIDDDVRIDDPVDDKPEKIYNCQIHINVKSPEKRTPFIIHLLEILVEKDIINAPTASSILVTFQVNGGPKFPKDSQKPVNEENVDELHIEGTEQAKEKFITAIIALINNKQSPEPDVDNLLIILLELAVDNHVVQQTDVVNFAAKFGYTIKVDVHKIIVEVENQINLGEQGSYGTKYLSQVEIDDSNAEDNLPFADNLLTSLVDHKLIDSTFAINLLFTFGLTGKTKLGDIQKGKRIEPSNVQTLQITSGPDAKKKFIDNLSKLLNEPKPSQLGLIDILLELSLDNAVLDIQAAGQLAATYGCSVSIQVIQLSSEQQIEKPEPRPSGVKRVSDVTIAGSFADDLAPFLTQLTAKLASANICDAATGANVLSTFGVKGVQGNAVSIGDVSKLVIKGDSDAKSRFATSFGALINARAQHADQFELTSVVKVLLELLLDNAGMAVQDAAQLAVGHGVSVSIQETTIEFGSQVHKD